MRRPCGEPHVAGAALVVCPFRVGPLYCLMLFQIGWRALVLV